MSAADKSAADADAGVAAAALTFAAQALVVAEDALASAVALAKLLVAPSATSLAVFKATLVQWTADAATLAADKFFLDKATVFDAAAHLAATAADAADAKAAAATSPIYKLVYEGISAGATAVAAYAAGKATSAGAGLDVHITTFNGLSYDFTAVGEFEYVKATNGEQLDVQVRLQPVNGSGSFITAAAFEIGADRVTFDVNRPQLIMVDGKAVSLAPGQSIKLAGGTIFETAPNEYAVSYKAGELFTVQSAGTSLNMTASLGAGHPQGGVAGLLGTDSGNPANDFALPDGTILAQPIGDSALLGTFADAWRVTKSTSLFDPAPAPSPASTAPAAANVALLTNYMASAFTPASDGHGATPVTDPQAGQQILLALPHAA